MLGWLASVAGSRLMRLVASALAVMGGILAVFSSGKRAEKKRQRIKDLEDYKETKERMDEVPTDLERSDAIDRMRGNDLVRKD